MSANMSVIPSSRIQTRRRGFLHCSFYSLFYPRKSSGLGESQMRIVFRNTALLSCVHPRVAKHATGTGTIFAGNSSVISSGPRSIVPRAVYRGAHFTAVEIGSHRCSSGGYCPIHFKAEPPLQGGQFLLVLHRLEVEGLRGQNIPNIVLLRRVYIFMSTCVPFQVILVPCLVR